MTSNTESGYPFREIEPKWQHYWESKKTFAATDDTSRPKYYVLDMFPYPSGDGLHVGHPEGYTASDIVARYKRMNGFNVLHPMGYDAFGLPAEQYAIKTGTHPRITTEKNINRIREQIKSLGFSYDWDREVDTTDPKYYRWTQWIFLKLYNSYFDALTQKARPISALVNDLEAEKLLVDFNNEIVLNELHTIQAQSDIPVGMKKWFEIEPEVQREIIDNQRLAYQAEVAVNWCPELGTVLANEEVIGGVSERGGHPVIRKPMRQWMLRITAYAERLLNDLSEVDWTDGIKKLQRDWIGKSVGAEVDFAIDGAEDSIRVYTTRPDTLFGATYMVLAPEHPLVPYITSDTQKDEVKAYIEAASRKSDLDRTDLAKDKTGVFTGACAVNPVNGNKIPVWISDYVLISYGTGAIMAVPAHDERDFEFAKTFDLPITAVVKPTHDWLAGQVKGNKIDAAWAEKNNQTALLDEIKELGADAGEALEKIYETAPGLFAEAFTELGTAINSGDFNGLKTDAFKQKISEWLAEQGLGKKAVNYKLRDWLFSRQRYWGEPFPIVHLENGSTAAVDEKDLPVLLPEVETYQPSGTGESPLATIPEWLNTEYDGKKAKRETNTMPQWAGSCWYYLRYIDAHNDQAPFDKEKEEYWMPVDLYVGGAEHAVLHLLYSRFWHKVLYDCGWVSTAEPFTKLVNQGMILGDDGQKMSKSRGNVVNPDQVIHNYGADSMRLYEMFMGPLDATKPWNMNGVEGVHRFLQKAWRLIIDEEGKVKATIQDVAAEDDALRTLHKTIKKVTQDIETFGFNTAISQMMIFVNEYTKLKVCSKSAIEQFVLLLAPFSPHVAEELWQRLGHENTLAYEPWPSYDDALTVDAEVEIAIQIMGKVRDKIMVAADADEETVKEMALASEKIVNELEGKTVRKVIVIKNRLVNIVAN